MSNTLNPRPTGGGSPPLPPAVVTAAASDDSADPAEKRAAERRAKEEAARADEADQKVAAEIAEAKAKNEAEAIKTEARSKIAGLSTAARSLGRGFLVAAGIFRKLAESCEGMDRNAEGAVMDAHGLQRADPARGVEMLRKFLREAKTSSLWSDEHFRLAIPVIEQAEKQANEAFKAERDAARKESEKHAAAQAAAAK